MPVSSPSAADAAAHHAARDARPHRGAAGQPQEVRARRSPRRRRSWRSAAAAGRRRRAPTRPSTASPLSAASSKASRPRTCAAWSIRKRSSVGSGVVALVLKGEDGKGTVAIGVTDDLTGKILGGRADQAGDRCAGRAGRRRPARHGAGRRPRWGEGRRGDGRGALSALSQRPPRRPRRSGPRAACSGASGRRPFGLARSSMDRRRPVHCARRCACAAPPLEHIEDAGDHDDEESNKGDGVRIFVVEHRTEEDGPEDLAVLQRRDLARRRGPGRRDEQHVAGAAERADQQQQRQFFPGRPIGAAGHQHQRAVEHEDVDRSDADQAGALLVVGDAAQHGRCYGAAQRRGNRREMPQVQVTEPGAHHDEDAEKARAQ